MMQMDIFAPMVMSSPNQLFTARSCIIFQMTYTEVIIYEPARNRSSSLDIGLRRNSYRLFLEICPSRGNITQSASSACASALALAFHDSPIHGCCGRSNSVRTSASAAWSFELVKCLPAKTVLGRRVRFMDVWSELRALIVFRRSMSRSSACREQSQYIRGDCQPQPSPGPGETQPEFTRAMMLGPGFLASNPPLISAFWISKALCSTVWLRAFM